MSHHSLSAFPISCCTFTFMVDAKVGAVASSRLRGWSAATSLLWCKVTLQLEKDEASAAYEMR